MRSLLSLLLFILSGILIAQIPDGGTMLNAESGTTYQRIGLCTLSEVAIADQPFTKALRITTQSDLSNAWDAQIKFPAVQGIQEEDVLLVAFYARTISSSEETGEGFLKVCIEENVNYAKQLYYTISIGQEWKAYYAPVKCTDTWDVSTVSYLFHLGFSNQTIEVADVKFLNYHQTITLEELPLTEITYLGQAEDASWRIPAQERINQIRKGQADVVVYDLQGLPVEDASVKIEMVRHQFGFGTAIAAHEFNNNETYRNTLFEMFNEVVFENDLKWPQFNAEASNDHIIQAMDSLDAHQIPIRGHNVIWPSYRFCPSFLQDLENKPELMRNAIDQHIDEVTSFTNGRLNDWDVMNEPYSEHDLQDVLGDEVMADWFKRVRRTDRDVKLYINDYSILSAGGSNKLHQDYYYKVINYIDSLGGNIEGIGMQGHFASELTSIDRVYEILERFATLDKEIKITEHDVDLTQRGVQADYTRDFLTMVFSHPSVKSLLMWGFWEGRHWKPESAFYEEDWSIRPHGLVWKDLIYNQWWTPEVNVLSGTQGELSFDGFLGTYKYTVVLGDLERTGTFVMDQSFESGQINPIKISLDEAIPDAVEITPSRAGFLCQGEEVLLNAPVGEGLEYSWFRNDTLLLEQTSILNTGQAGSYTVKVSKNGLELSSEPYHLEVRTMPEVELTLSGSVGLCEGDSVLMSVVSEDGMEYEWMKGDVKIQSNDPSLTVYQSGNYRLMVTSHGCSAEAGMEVTVDQRPEVTIEALGELSFCEGEDLLLRTAPVPGLVYSWTREDVVIEPNNFRIRVAESGMYSVSTAIGGCKGISDTLEVKVYPVPESSIEVSGELSFCEGGFVILSGNSGEGLSYAWMLGGRLLEKPERTINAEQEGSYTLITRNEGCSSTSEPVLVTVLSITDPQCANGIESNLVESLVYPNPFKETFQLRLGSPSEADARVELYNAQGKLILVHKLNRGSELVELSVKEPGFYMLHLHQKERTQTIRLTAL